MSTITEGTHKLEDGTELYTKKWITSSAKARILFVHGFSDHCNNYEDLFPYFISRGIDVYAFDQRGWGRSVHTSSQKGLTGPTSTVLSDITSLLETVLPSPVPLFLMGHSMGGAETLLYASTGPSSTVSQITGFVASAPLVALHSSTRPWRPTVLAGRVAGKLLPKFKLVNKLDPKWLSHDEELNKQWAADPLNHDTGTLEGLAGMLDRGEQLETGQCVLAEGRGAGGKSRVLVVHGTDDHVNLCEASKVWVERCKEVSDKKFVSYEGGYHNLHVEPAIKARYSEDIADWILERAEPSTKAQVSKL